MFYYDENKMNDMLSLVNKNLMQMRNMEDGYLDNMKPISRSGIYGNGIEMIDSQIVSIKDGLTDFKNITSNNSNAFLELEKRLKLEVEDIPLPKDFDASDTGLGVSTDSVKLSKNDGNKINSNNNTNKQELDNNYSNNTKNISKLKKEELDTKELVDYTKANIEVLNKLKTEKLVQTNFDDDFKIKMKELASLNLEQLSDAELEDYLKTKKISLQDIISYINILDTDLGDEDEDKS